MPVAVQRRAAEQHHPRRRFRAQQGLGTGVEYREVFQGQRFAVEFELAGDRIERTFGVFGGNGQGAARLEIDRDVQRVHQHGHRRAFAEGMAGDDGERGAGQFDHRQCRLRMVRERGRVLFVRQRQRHPGLQAVHALWFAAQAVGRAFECTMPRPAVIQFTSPG